MANFEQGALLRAAYDGWSKFFNEELKMSHYSEQYEKQAELDMALNRRLVTAHIMSEYHQLAEEMKALKEELESLKQELTKRQGGAII